MIDFLGIGAQKSGTTWVIKNIKEHPAVWIPHCIKELHYFDVLYLGYGRKSQLNRIRRKMQTVINSEAWGNAISDKEYDYFSKIYDPDLVFTDEWYEHIFSRANGKVKGEFTPAYCAIGDRGIAHVRKMMPDVKLIYMVRDPYDRAMSSLRMLLERERFKKTDMEQLVEKPLFIKKGDYAQNIPAWEKAFDSAQILYIPFGRIKSDPAGVMRDVEAFLGLDRFDRYPALNKKVNATGKKKIEIPEKIIWKIRQMTAPQYPYLVERFREEFVSLIK